MKTTPPETATSREARTVLIYLAEPSDTLLGSLLQVTDPCDVVAAIRSGTIANAISGG